METSPTFFSPIPDFLSLGRGESFHFSEPLCLHSREDSDLCAAGLGHYWEALMSQEVGSALVTGVPPRCKTVSLNDSPE